MALIFFEKMNGNMNDAERREFFSLIIEKVEIYEEEQPNGQWLKSITFKLPIIPHDMKISLDKGDHVETVCLPDWYDPSIATKDEYLGKRQHEKSAEEKEKSLQDSIRKSWYW